MEKNTPPATPPPEKPKTTTPPPAPPPKKQQKFSWGQRFHRTWRPVRLLLRLVMSLVIAFFLSLGTFWGWNAYFKNRLPSIASSQKRTTDYFSMRLAGQRDNTPELIPELIFAYRKSNIKRVNVCSPACSPDNCSDCYPTIKQKYDYIYDDRHPAKIEVDDTYAWTTYMLGRQDKERGELYLIFIAETKVVEKTDGSFSIVLDLGVDTGNPLWVLNASDNNVKLGGKENSQIKRIDWYRHKGMSETQEILLFEKWGWVGLELKQPTSTASLVSWLKMNWIVHSPTYSEYFSNDVGEAAVSAKISLSKPQLENIVCPELERIFQEDWGNIATKPEVICIRIVNGSIQFWTVWFFFTGMVLTCFQAWDRYREKRILKLIREEHFDFHNELSLPESEEKFRAKLGVLFESKVISIVWSVFAADQKKYDHRDMSDHVGSLVAKATQKNENDWFLWQFFIGSLAGIGFLGTVWGIGEALMGVSSVLSDELTKQQSGVSKIALSLGTAFDTTLVSLSLSIFAAFWVSWFTYKEKKLLFSLEEYLSSELISGVRSKTRGGDPASSPIILKEPSRRPDGILSGAMLEDQDNADKFRIFKKWLFRAIVVGIIVVAVVCYYMKTNGHWNLKFW